MLKTTPFMLFTRFEEIVPRWEASEAFRAAHNPAEDNNPLYLDHPQFEGFEIRQMGHRETAEWHEQSIMARPDTLDWNKSLSSWLGLKKSGGSHGSNNAGSRG
jgi:hypothetical protein